MEKMVEFIRVVRRRERTNYKRSNYGSNKAEATAMLLHLAGPDVQEIFTTFTDTGNDTDYARAVDVLNAYFVAQVNSAFARQTFHQISQKPRETVQQFATRLKKAAKDCDFGTDADNQIRDAVLNKTHIKRKLLEEGQGLNLKRTLEIAEQCEKIETQLAALSVVIPSAHEKARLAESVVGRIILRKSARQNHMLTRLERDSVTPNMTMHLVSMKVNNQK